ncbi:MAG: DUF3783 domain-containing protein [Deltaproteobacteria bacterium]|jgi:hypothetical protein|nr:DUF3783 domain-containing protein [Deltaproteobacteria bacterium]
MNSTFKKIQNNDKHLYGPRKAVFTGFKTDAQPELIKVLENAGLAELPTAWPGKTEEGLTLDEIFTCDDKLGWGKNSKLCQTIIVGGISQKQLKIFMALMKKSHLEYPLWATLTPVSQKWKLKELLNELKKNIAVKSWQRLQKLKKQNATPTENDS